LENVFASEHTQSYKLNSPGENVEASISGNLSGVNRRVNTKF